VLVPQSFIRMSVVFAAALSACAMQPHGEAQVQAAPSHTQVQSRAQLQTRAIVGVSVTCTANPASIFTGGTVTVQAKGNSVQGLPLHYAFTTDAGQLAVTGATAKLNTAGLGPRTAHVTCTAIDSTGRSASQVVEVKVLSAPHTEQLHIPQSGVSGAVIKPQPVPPPPPVIIRGGQTAAKTDQQQQQQPREESHPASVSPSPAPPPPSPKPAPAPAPAPDTVSPDEAKVAPVPVPLPAPVPETTQPAVPDEYKQSRAVADWVSHLQNGKIEYQVPSQMLMQQASTVTVVIHGFQDVNTTTLPQATGSDMLKQSERMKVGLLADGDAFTITPQDADSIKFIPINGISTWTWKVTPNKSGAKQPLEIIVWLVYPNADKTEQQVQNYKTTVQVDVPSVWSTVVDQYQHDPTKFFSYMIPGGAGFTFLAGLVVWWWKRKHKDEKD